MTFNIAIDGLTATGKTSIGHSLAKRLNFNFIDSGLFYRYLAYYNINSINFNQHTYDNLINCSNSSAFSSLDISQKASELSKDEEIRSLINQEIKKLTKKKGFVVVGRDVTTNILPDAEFKILLSADFETRLGRRVSQLVDENPQNIFYDIITRDTVSKPLINCSKKVSKEINTSDLEIFEVIEKILQIIKKKNSFKKCFKFFLFFLLFLLSFLLNQYSD